VKNIRDEIRSLNVSKENKIITFLTSLIIPLILFSGLITFTINMFIYYDFYLLFVFLLYISIILVAFITNYLYLESITQKQIKGIKKICLSNLIIYGATLLYIFIMLFGGGY
jgi:ABC-type bacteriocin/lantibiotic exporter with double-glycine peptidase domain